MEIKIPYNFEPRWYQLEYLQSLARFKVVVLHRRAGKSAMALNGQIAKCLATPAVYYYFLPTYRQAKTVIWDELVKKHVPPQLTKKINESELTIYWKNGSIQRFVGCDDINKHRGINPIDCVFDEFSEMNPDIWLEIVQPVLRQNGGTASWIFTPKGINNGSYKILQQAKDDESGEWYQSVRGWRDTHVFTVEQIREAKKQTTESIFRQEYECSFESSSGAFFRGVRDAVIPTSSDLSTGLSTAYSTEPIPSHAYQLGIDLAKYNDWTVITPIDLNTLIVQPQERFNQVDWNLQKARIESAARKWNNATIKIDRTGVGDPVVEDLIASGLNINFETDAIKFTQRSKNEMLIHLAMMIEQSKVRLPKDDGLISELESMQYERLPNGHLKFGSPSGVHDDRVMSLALSLIGVNNALGTDNLPEPIKQGPVIKTYATNNRDSMDKFSCF